MTEKRSGLGTPHVGRRPMKIDGIEYTHMGPARRALGLHSDTVRKRLNSPDYPNYQWLETAAPTKGVTVEVVSADQVFAADTPNNAEVILDHTAIEKRIAHEHEYALTVTDADLRKDGTLFCYFSNALEGPTQLPLQEWAHRITAPDCEGDIGVAISLDLPAMIENLLGTNIGHVNEVGGYTVDRAHFDGVVELREQLIEALVKFNRVQFEDF